MIELRLMVLQPSMQPVTCYSYISKASDLFSVHQFGPSSPSIVPQSKPAIVVNGSMGSSPRSRWVSAIRQLSKQEFDVCFDVSFMFANVGQSFCKGWKKKRRKHGEAEHEEACGRLFFARLFYVSRWKIFHYISTTLGEGRCKYT